MAVQLHNLVSQFKIDVKTATSVSHAGVKSMSASAGR